MSNKPRESILNLFDPLLVDAMHVPIPESPPSTPKKRGVLLQVDESENLAPNPLTMSAFFNRVSNRAALGASIDCTEPSHSLLVDLGVESSERTRHTSTIIEDNSEKLTDEDLLPIYGTPRKNLQIELVLSTPKVVPPSSAIAVEAVSTLVPTSPEVNFSSSAYSDILHTAFPRDSNVVLSEDKFSSPGPEDNSKPHPRRRSSLDSLTISVSSVGRLAARDASFDLIHGDMSFLSKLSDDESGAISDGYMLNAFPKTSPILHPNQGLSNSEEVKPSSRLLDTIDDEPAPSTLISSRFTCDSTPQASFFRTKQVLSSGSKNASTSRPSSIASTPTGSYAKARMVLPAPVKRSKIFTSGLQRTSSAEMAKPVVGAQRLPSTITSQTLNRPQLPISAAPLKGGARRVLVSQEAAPGLSRAPPPKKPLSRNLVATNVRPTGPLPPSNSSSVGSDNHIAVKAVRIGIPTPTQALPAASKPMASRLPAPVGIGRGIPVRTKATRIGVPKASQRS